MLILDLTTPPCSHVYSFTSHHDAFWRHTLLFAISDGWNNPSWRIKGRCTRLGYFALPTFLKKKKNRAIPSTPKLFSRDKVFGVLPNVKLATPRERKWPRNFFEREGNFFSSEKKSSPRTFPFFDSLHKVLSELRILKLVVIRFQTGNGWKAL